MEFIIYILSLKMTHILALFFTVYLLWMFEPTSFKGVIISVVMAYAVVVAMTSPSYFDMKNNLKACYENGLLKKDHKLVEERCYVKYDGFVKVTDIPTKEI